MKTRSIDDFLADAIGGHGKSKACWTEERKEAMSKKMIALWTDEKKQEARERQKAYWIKKRQAK